jgi:hypothetical protein
MNDTTNGTHGSTGKARADLPLNLSTAPEVPAAVADLWQGWGYSGATDPEGIRTALDGVTTLVNALVRDDARWVVGLKGGGTAWSDLKARRANITSAALADERLTIMQRLGITSGMAVHEAGHGRLSQPMQSALRRYFGPDGARAWPVDDLSNLLDDVRLEARTATEYPAYAGLFDLTLWWVAQRFPIGRIGTVPASQRQAWSFAVAATRYSAHTVWSNDPDVIAERTWWEQWATRGTLTDRPIDHVAAIREALDHIAHLPEHAPLPEQPEQDEDEDQPEQSEDTDEQGDQPAEQDPEDEQGEQDDDWDQPGEDGESDEDEAEGDEQSDDESADWDSLSGGNGDDEQDPEDADESEDDGEGDEAGEQGDPAPSAAGDESDDEDADEDWDDLPESDEGMYHHADGESERGPQGDEGSESEDTTYGHEGGTDWDGTADNEGTEQRDGLAETLPLHGEDAATEDDRNRDIATDRWMERAARAESAEVVVVNHPNDGTGYHSPTVRVGVVELDTHRTKIDTSPDKQGALRAAFAARRTQHDNRNVARSGRISGSRAYRVRAGFDNVFTRRDALSPDRLDVHLLVDASGSMSGHRLEQAAVIAANLTEALAWLPNVRVNTWAHHTGNGTTLFHAHDSRTTQPVGRIAGIKSAGANNDASAIAALTVKILADRGSRERSIMVVLSDGAPCEPEPWVRGAVEGARRQGIGVVSVAVAGGLTRTQEVCYGPENVVPWTGDWDMLGRGMAQIIGRLA